MSNQSDTVKILLLGSVQAYVGTRQVALRGRAARIALARLALAGGRPVPVSALIDDLWQEKHPRDAVHALQAHMHRLRALLPLHIEFVNDGYRIVGGTAELDAKLFGELSERGRSHLAAARPQQAASDLEQALGLWRGPALGEIDDVPGLRPFAVQLTEMQKAAITDHGEALLQCGRGESLITGLRASLALDPLQETAWHQLMRALWHTGRESEALNAYANARESFLDVLGAEPGTRLAELHAAMLSGAPDETPPAVRAASAGPASAPIADGPVLDGPVLDGPGLVGRREELASMELALRRSREGTQFVTVSGEPGIGKTRLAEELRRRATASGAIVLNGGCDPSVPVAHLPFTQMLRHYVHSDQDDDPELRRRAPELANVLPMLSGRLGDDPVPPADGAREVDPYSTMDAITAWLAHLAARRPLVLIIDDLQWADPQTLLTLRHLLHSPRRVKALVVLCLRDTRLPVDEASPVSEFLRQSDRVTHIPLTRFTDDETAELTAAEQELFPTAAVPHWLDEYVLSAAGGNPLFIVELTRQLLIGEVDDAGGIPPLPAGITAVIQSRIEHLPPETLAILQHAAVIGPSFELASVAELCDLSPAQAEADLRAAQEGRLIETTPTDAYRFWFSHDVVRTVLYESLPVVERARLHRHVAESIASESTDDVLKKHESLAHHYRHSDLSDAAIRTAEHLLLAGREAAARGALAAARDQLADALTLLRRDQDDPLRCDVLTALGQAQLRSARPEYRETLLEASRLAISLGDSARLTRAVIANNRGWWSNTIAVDHERVAHIEAALAKCPEQDEAARAQLLIAWALENARDTAARPSVLEAAEQALELAERTGDDHVLGSVLSHRYAVLYATFGSPTECLRINERLLALSNKHGSPKMRLSAALGLAQSSMRLGEFSLADRYLHEAAQLAETLDDANRMWLVRGWQAMREITRGRFDKGEALMTETFQLGDRTRQADAPTWFAGQLFTVRMLQGRLNEIIAHVRDQVGTVADHVPSWKAAMALTLARTGYQDESAALLDEFAADNFARIPRDMLWLNGLHYFAMTCEALGRADAAAALYRLLLPFSGMVATNATIGAGPVDLHLGVLARLRGQRDVADRHLQAAAALCRRIDSKAWLAQVEQRQAAPRAEHAGSPR